MRNWANGSFLVNNSPTSFLWRSISQGPRMWITEENGTCEEVEQIQLRLLPTNAKGQKLDALMGSLNRKGERELSLHMQLEKFYDRIWEIRSC
ncbi:hypothetical protein V5N11_001493 [Cardamine amara subsp. amara]|uniref:WHIM2 domain-containing protein n=1 Tax=Cardamine amara subsp. amara TaxID=228776 RepID=A0ABD0ZLD6_CARAN